MGILLWHWLYEFKSTSFFKKIVYLFIFKQSGKVGERRREISVCGCLSPVPTGDLAHNPGMCPDWESNQWPFGSQASTQSTDPHQPGVNPPALWTKCIVFWLCQATCLLDWHINPVYTFTFGIVRLHFNAWQWVSVAQNLPKHYEYQSENMADFHKSPLLRDESLFCMKVICRTVFHSRKNEN